MTIDYFVDPETSSELKCPRCGTIAKPEEKLCSVCQSELTPEAPQPTVKSSPESDFSSQIGTKVKSVLSRIGKKVVIHTIPSTISLLRLNRTLIVSMIITSILGTLVFSRIEGGNSQSEGDRTKDLIIAEIAKPEEPTNSEPETLRYGGASCLVALFERDLSAAVEKEYPQYRFHYQERSSHCSLNLEPLLSGQLNFIYSNRPLTEKERQLAAARNLKLVSIPIGTDALVPYLNPDLNLGHLTVEELRAIFSGTITNWQQLGGPDLTISPVVLDTKNNHDLNLLMGEPNYTQASNTVLVPDHTTAVQQVAATPGAISLASIAIVKNQESVNSISVARNRSDSPVTALIGNRQVNLIAFQENSYPLTRSLFIILPDSEAVDTPTSIYLDFLHSERGQQILGKNGLITVSPWN